VSTAAPVPETRDELEGDEALETLRELGGLTLLQQSFVRFRAADGFSHSRALAFQFTLTLLPALIAVVGLAVALEQEDFRRVVQETLNALAPGSVGDLLTAALRQGSSRARSESAELALAAGGATALVSGASAMGQIERGANRIYGVERDRPLLRKYGLGLLLAASAGVLTLLAVVVLVGGRTISRSTGWGSGFEAVWDIARWPVGIALAVTAVAILFQVAPRRRQPEASWLAFGAGVSALLWLACLGLLAVYVQAANSFGATYGPVAGTIGVLLWAFLSSLALFGGLAFAAQLEAVRAGAPEPRVERDHSSPPPPG